MVSSFREGNNLMLNIDKGSSAGIKAGDGGMVLQGAGGEDPLDGGNIRIIKVLDANKSVGQTTLRSIGKTNRVAITLGH